MMSSGKLKSRPPGEPASVEEFISGATTKTRQKPLTRPAAGLIGGQGRQGLETRQKAHPQERYPWQAPSVREDITKVYNLRLPEGYLLKLKYIAEHTPESMQKFCLDLLLPAIDAKIKELTQERQMSQPIK